MPRPRKPARLVRIRGKENWYVRDRREVYSAGTPDEEEAKCFLAEYILAKDVPKSPTISKLLDMRLANLKAAGKSRAADSLYIHKMLKADFGDLRPSQLTQAKINSYWEKRQSVPAALREDLLELKTTLRMAERQGLIEKAPYIEVPAKRPPKETFLTREQGQELLKAAKPIHLRLYLLIAMTTGARKSAILGLTWERVDLERGRIDFTDPELAVTKKRRTVVPVAPEVIAALRRAEDAAETGFVIEFMGKSITSIKTSFRVAAKEAGLPWASPHTLKHSVVSWLAEDGFTVDQISDLTATHPNTVRRIYRKYSPDYLKPMAASLAKTVSFTNQFAKPVLEA